LVSNGAQVIDVRTKGEYQQGHIKGSVNLPLDSLNQRLHKLDKNKVVIACCASGMRSGQAKGILKSNGFEVYNAGSWINLQRKLS